MGGGVIDYCSFKRPCWDWSSTQKNKEIPCFVDPCYPLKVVCRWLCRFFFTELCF